MIIFEIKKIQANWNFKFLSILNLKLELILSFSLKFLQSHFTLHLFYELGDHWSG